MSVPESNFTQEQGEAQLIFVLKQPCKRISGMTLYQSWV